MPRLIRKLTKPYQWPFHSAHAKSKWAAATWNPSHPPLKSGNAAIVPAQGEGFAVLQYPIGYVPAAASQPLTCEQQRLQPLPNQLHILCNED